MTKFFDMVGAMETGKDIAETITEVLEHEAGKEIFTLRILDKNVDDQSIQMVIVFKDKSVLMANVTVPIVGNRLAVQLQGNFI
jgi:hypothetical protein